MKRKLFLTTKGLSLEFNPGAALVIGESLLTHPNAGCFVRLSAGKSSGNQSLLQIMRVAQQPQLGHAFPPITDPSAKDAICLFCGGAIALVGEFAVLAANIMKPCSHPTVTPTTYCGGPGWVDPYSPQRPT